MGTVGSWLKTDDPPMAGNKKRSMEMKRELSELGMYEDGMSSEEMQEMLTAVNASKGQTEMQRENSGIKIESPTAAEPAFPERSTSKLTKRTTRDSVSPDQQPNLFSNRKKDRKKSSDDDIFSELVRSSETAESNKPYVPTPSPPRPANNAPTSQENHKNVTTRKIQPKFVPALQKWEIDPLDCKKDDDPPLKARSNGGKAPPMRFLEINGVPQIPEDIRQFISNHLTQVSRNHFINNKEFYEEPIQWGAPIKVGIANGSLDKNPRRESSPTPSTSQEVNDSSVALRAMHIEESKGKGEDDVFTFGDEDDADFQTTRKRQRTTKLITALPERSPLMRKARMKTISLDTPKEEEEEDPDWTDSSRGTASRKRPLKLRESTPDVQKKRDQSPEYNFAIKGKQKSNLSDYVPNSPSETSNSGNAYSPPTYPRRVVPPNPSKPKGRGGGKRQEQSKILKNRPELSIQLIPDRKKKEPGLFEEEIQKAVESGIMTDDEEDGEQIYVSEPTSKRTANAMAILMNANKKEQEDENRKKSVERAKKAQEDEVRQERVQRRIREEASKLRAAEALERFDKEKTERWNSGMKTRNSGRRTELDGEQSRHKNVYEWDPNNSGDNEVQVVPDEPKTSVECPVCGKWFSEKDVEGHAANCMDFSMEEGNKEGHDEVEEVVERTSSTSVLICQICDNYRTRNGNQLADHITDCIAEKGRASGSQVDVIPISDSPPHSYESISSLEGSQIDYNMQRSNTRRASPRGSDKSKKKRYR